ncbi:MAG: 4Fe-4S binding protein [Fidelibacterota bacterium]
MLPDLSQFARDNDIDAIGVADVELLRFEEPAAMALVPEDLPRAVVLGIRLLDSIVNGIEDRPTPLYFHLYRQTNFALDRKAHRLALKLQRDGYQAMTVPASQIVDPRGRRGLVSHRLLGYAAGLGWIGRPTLLIHPRFGARLRYVSILTDAPYSPGDPMPNRCGECRACVHACPAGAIRDSSRDFDLDACHRKLSEFRKLPFIGQHVCGICVKACPGPAPV